MLLWGTNKTVIFVQLLQSRIQCQLALCGGPSAKFHSIYTKLSKTSSLDILFIVPFEDFTRAYLKYFSVLVGTIHNKIIIGCRCGKRVHFQLSSSTSCSLYYQVWNKLFFVLSKLKPFCAAVHESSLIWFRLCSHKLELSLGYPH